MVGKVVSWLKRIRASLYRFWHKFASQATIVENNEVSMITYKFLKSEDRSVALDEAGKEVGECTVTTHPKYWSIDHTYVNPNNRGQGIAQGLLEAVIEAAKKAGVKLQPVCSYAVKAFQEKAEYQALQY